MLNKKFANIIAVSVATGIAISMLAPFAGIGGGRVNADEVEQTTQSTEATESTESTEANGDSDEEEKVYDYEATTGIGGFVNRLYSVSLGRLPDPTGFEDWYDQLDDGEITGAQAARGFLLSQEFINRGYSDEEYVGFLYRVFFDREPDNAGMEDWITRLSNNVSREEVLAGFYNSTEWANVCLSFGIVSGGTGIPDQIPEANEGVKTFVNSLYQDCLDREPDENGFNSWCDNLTSLRVSGKSAAYGFFFSSEFSALTQDMEPEELISIFYKVFLNRVADTNGINYWLDVMERGGGIGDLFNGFADSQEFSLKCESYGINAGEHIDVPLTATEDTVFAQYMQDSADAVALMNTVELEPHRSYLMIDVQGHEDDVPTSEVVEITDEEWAAAETFAQTHFQPSWTPGQKALYTMYWIHTNVTYASNSNLWGQIGGMGPAQAIFEKQIGQCAQYNGAMCVMLCYLGYDANMIKGYRGTTSGSRYQHFWCEVTIEDTVYVMEVGNQGHDGSWHYFCTPYGQTRKFIKNSMVMGGY